MTVLPIDPPVTAAAAPADDDGPLRSVSTAVAVLDCFTTEPELGATRVAARLGIAKSTACRMLAALATGGLLERTGSGRYRLGLRMFEYGQLAVDRMTLREVALPVLGDLREVLRETVQLGVVSGTDVVYLERVESSTVGMHFRNNYRRTPGHSSSTGKAFAAHDPDLAAQMLAGGLVRHTPFTIVDPRRYRIALAQTREQGYATSREEYAPGWSSVAAPVLLGRGSHRRAVAALSVVGVTAQVLGPRRPVVVQEVRRAADRVAAALERCRG